MVIALALGAYALVRYERSELVDFAVPRTAAARALAAEPLYRPDDGHYQYKYFPAFAFAMAPFALVPKEAGEFIWFAFTVAMAWGFVRLSLKALPQRRRAVRPLVWLTLLLMGKFLVKELAFGQFNLPLGLLLLGAILAAQRRREGLSGALVGAGVFIKPYALVLVPWLLLTRGRRAWAGLVLALAAGLLLPVARYGWAGNVTLLQEWYRTVSQTTAPNLMGYENISFASMWAKWIGPGAGASLLAGVTSVVAVGVGLLMFVKRRQVQEPDFLEGAYFFLLVPLLSPQGWDYVLLLALPAYMLLVDRWRELPLSSRTMAAAGFMLTSFAIFDLLRRPLYTQVMLWAGTSVGALLLAAVIVRVRLRAEA